MGSEMCIRDSVDCLEERVGERLGVRLVLVEADAVGVGGERVPDDLDLRVADGVAEQDRLVPVSYTHLTLPTSDLVQISVVAVSFNKNTSYASNAAPMFHLSASHNHNLITSTTHPLETHLHHKRNNIKHTTNTSK